MPEGMAARGKTARHRLGKGERGAARSYGAGGGGARGRVQGHGAKRTAGAGCAAGGRGATKHGGSGMRG